MVGELSSDMAAGDRVQRTMARGGLLTFGLLLLPLSLLGYWFLDVTRTSLPLNLPTLPLMLAPAAASVATRLIRREGFGDVSFQLGGRRSLGALALGLALPLLIGALAYGAAYLSGLARLAPPELPLLPGSAGPAAHLTALLLLAGTLGTLALLPGAAGEEIGWRGYPLPRLVAAGAPRPLLLGVASLLLDQPLGLQLALIWAAHIGIDRAVGYGLKYADAFKHTHLGEV